MRLMRAGWRPIVKHCYTGSPSIIGIGIIWNFDRIIGYRCGGDLIHYQAPELFHSAARSIIRDRIVIDREIACWPVADDDSNTGSWRTVLDQEAISGYLDVLLGKYAGPKSYTHPASNDRVVCNLQTID